MLTLEGFSKVHEETSSELKETSSELEEGLGEELEEELEEELDAASVSYTHLTLPTNREV